MANPYYITYQFNPLMLAGGDTFRLKIKFKVNEEGTDETRTPEDEGIFINDPGSTEEEFDFEKLMLAVGFYSPTLIVPDGCAFEQLIYENDNAEKNSEVIVDIMWDGEIVYENEFTGTIVMNTIDHDPDTQYLRFEAAPDTDILNRRMLYDLEDPPAATNPLGYSVPGPSSEHWAKLKQIILDCYKLVNPDLVDGDLDFFQDWTWCGYYVDNEGDKIMEYDITSEEIQISTTPLFFDQSYGLSSVGDVLRKLAIDFCCLTGMTSNKKPFFKRLFSTHSSQTYLLDDDSYYNHEKKYVKNLVYYVRLVTRWNSVTYGWSFEYVFHAPSASAFTQLENTYLERDSLVVAHSNNLGAGSPTWNDMVKATNIMCSRLSPTRLYFIIAAKDSDYVYTSPSTEWFNFSDLSFVPPGKIAVDFWYDHTGKPIKCRTDTIVAPGLRHSIIKNPIFKGKTYQPIRVKKIYKENRTEIDGIIIA